MKSMPAASAMRASCRHSGQLADQRSGTLVAERPDEQFAPKMPIFRTLALYMARRSCIAAVRASKALLRASQVSVPSWHDGRERVMRDLDDKLYRPAISERPGSARQHRAR